jgi:hypothetical protein
LRTPFALRAHSAGGLLYAETRAARGSDSSCHDVWAVGYIYLTSACQNLMEHWDGVAWNRADVPRVRRADNQLYGLARDGAGGLWAVGNFYPNDLTKPISTLVLRGAP